MARQWRLVSREDATRHPLYGLRGGPMVFAMSLCFYVLYILSPLAEEARSANMTLVQFFDLAYPEIVFPKMLLALSTAATGAICALMLLRHRLFRLVSMTLLMACWPLAAVVSAVMAVPSLDEMMAQSVLPWLISLFVWTAYLQRSRAVRVTFEHSVLLSDISRTS